MSKLMTKSEIIKFAISKKCTFVYNNEWNEQMKDSILIGYFQEAYGDRIYRYKKDTNTIYENWYSIGD